LTDITPEKTWKPNPGPQEEFLALPDSIFEGFYGGAAGGGKSDALLMYPIVRGFYKNPAFKGIIFRRTFPQLEESLILRSKTAIGVEGPSYYDFGAKYNDQKHVWTFPSGASIRFSYMDRDEDALDHKSAEYNYAAFDELTTFTEFMYTYLTSRVRSSDPSLPAIVRSASNPGDIGHLWVRVRFVEPHKFGYKVIHARLPNNQTIKRIFIPAKLSDNPHLNEADPNYANRLELLPEAERKALKDGDWWTFSGQFFTEFRSIRFLFEPENALHVIEPFDVPEFWPKIISIDWGYDHKTAVYWTAVSPDERAIVYREMTCRKRLISDWAPEVAKFSQFDGNIVARIIDPSSKQERGQEETIKDQISRYTGWDFEDADNSRKSGWMLIRDFLRWRPKSKKYIPKEGYNQETALRIWRFHGEKARDDYENLFKPEAPETNLPRLQIFNTCTDLINTIPLAVHNENDSEDIEKFTGDDPLDSLRYGIKAVHRYLDECKSEYQEIKARQEIINQFRETRDATSFYAKMRRFEAETKIVPIRLHRRHGYYGSRNVRGRAS
jgi:hypothetical protein